MIKTPDSSNRFCIDYRNINRITQIDAEPVGNPDEMFARLSKGRYFLKLDVSNLSKVV